MEDALTAQEIRTNEDLARAYTNVITRAGYPIERYLHLERKIAAYPINLPEYFATHQDFKQLSSKDRPQFNNKTREVLEWILDCGTEMAIKFLSLRRDRKINRAEYLDSLERKERSEFIEHNREDQPLLHAALIRIIGG